MLRSNRTPDGKKGGDNMNDEKQNYTLGHGPIELHSYGAYMSYSDKTGDYITAARHLKTYKVTAVRKVQTGVTHKSVSKAITEQGINPYTGKPNVLITGKSTAPEIVEVPVYKNERYDDTPDFQSFGTPIKVGDKVGVTLGSHKMCDGTLHIITDTHVVIRTDTGTEYFPWSAPVMVSRI